MKIYVSEKDNYRLEREILIGQTIQGHFVEIESEEEIEIESLEQHEAEIRKPLEDEIERLKATVGYYENIFKIQSRGIKYTIECENKLYVQKQARQEVIAELEEWVDKQPKTTYWLNDNESEEHIHIEQLKQKLKEMKEV